MQAIHDVAVIIEVEEAQCLGIIHDEEDLGLDTKLRIGAGIAQARAKSFTRGDVAGCMHPVDFDRVAGLDAMES